MRKVELTIFIKSTPEDIIAAFIDYNLLKHWWGVERALIEPKPGGSYTLAWNISKDGFGYVSSGVIKQYDAGKLLEISNLVYLNPEKDILGPMSFIVKAEQKTGGSEMYLCQDGYQTGGDWDWYYEVVKNAWPEVALILKTFLENRVSIGVE